MAKTYINCRVGSETLETLALAAHQPIALCIPTLEPMLEVYEEPLHCLAVLVHLADLINALDHAELTLLNNIHDALLRNVAEGAGDAKAGGVLVGQLVLVVA